MRLLGLLRVLLPSWRFFDDVAGSPTLLIRCGARGGELGPWQAVSLAAARHSAGSLFLSPRGNLALAHHTLLEQLLSDVADLDERLATGAAADAVPLLVSYRLVTRLARAKLAPNEARAREPGVTAPSYFQFKLTLFHDVDERVGRAHEADQRLQSGDDLLISQLHDA